MAELRDLGTVIYDAIKPLLPTAWVANWNAGGKKLTNLGAPEDPEDAARKAETDAALTAADDAAADAAAAAIAASSAQNTANTAVTNAATAQSTANAAAPATRTLTAGSGLTGGGTLAADRSFAVNFGTGATQVRPGNDAAYTDARTPTAHASSHQDGGSDEISVAGLSGKLADTQRAGWLAATGGDLAVGAITDGQMLVRSGTSVVSAAIPTGDITGVTAGTGLTGGATSGDATLAVVYGTTAGTSAQGNDSRLSDDRTAAGLRTASSIVSVSAATAPTSGQVLTATSSTAATWQTPTGDITSVVAGTGLSGGATSGAATLAVVYGSTSGTAAEGSDSRLSNARTPTAHAASHQDGGSDEISVAGLSGVLADAQKANVIVATAANLTVGAIADGEMLVRSGSTLISQAIPSGGGGTGDIDGVTAGTGLSGGGTTGTVTLNVVYGSSSGTATQGNDARLSDARTPTAHASTHFTGGTDPIAPSDIGAVPTTRTVTAGTGLTGGGDLSANRTLAVAYGTSGTTAAAGNDARLSDDRTASGLRTATTTVAIASATAPAAGQVLAATSGSAAAWSDPAVAVGGVTGLGSGVATFLGTPSSANLAAAVTGETGSGALVFATSPALVTPDLGTPSALVLTNATGRASSSQTADKIATSGTAVTISSTAPTAGQVLTASSGTAAAWADPTGGGGGGGPATQLTESGGPTTLTIGSIADGQLIRRSGTTAVGIAQSALALAASQITSGVFDQARTWTEFQTTKADTALTTSATTFATLNLPTAGTYKLHFVARARQTAATTLASLTFSLNGTVTEVSGSWLRGKRNGNVDSGQCYVASVLVQSQPSAAGDVHEIQWDGYVIVPSTQTLTLKVALGAGTGVLLRGTTAACLYESSNTTAYGNANYISITSGSGLEGSTYTSTNAGQWTADGVNISGETGTTYVLTRANLGKAIRCGDSNTIQMWTPAMLPDVYKTDGVNYGGWWDPNDSASVTLNSGNVASIANQFSGGAAQVQATSSLQVPLTSGFLVFPNSTQAANYGLLSASAICRKYLAMVLQYRAGTEMAFTAYAEMFGGNTNTRIVGQNSSSSLFGYGLPNGSDQTMVNINTSNHTDVPLPLPLSLVEATTQWPNAVGGPSSSSVNQNWQGKYGEFITLATPPDKGTLERVQGYLMWHAGIQAKIPPDHPYYNAPPRVS